MLEWIPDLLEFLIEIPEIVAGIKERRFSRRWRALSPCKRIGVILMPIGGAALVWLALRADAAPLRIAFLCAGIAALFWAIFTLFPIQPPR